MRVLLLLALLLAAPALGETVTIPFNPPVAEELRYRSERVTVRSQPGQPAIETSLANTATFRFTRGPGDGWTLIVTPGVDEVSGNAPEQALAIARAVATAGPPLPMEVRLDQQGNFLDLANADALMAEVRAAFARLRATPPEGLPAEVLDVAAASLTGRSRDAFVKQALATFQFAFAAAGREVLLDRPVPVEERLPLPTLGGTEVTYAMTVAATRLPGNRLRLTASGKADLAEIAPALEAYAAKLLEASPAWRETPEVERARYRDLLARQFLEAEHRVETVIDLDQATGLPLVASQRQHTQAPGPAGTVGRTETVTLTRLP